MKEKINKYKCPPLLLCDFYKTVHSEQYNPNMTKLVSYLTARKSRIEGEDKLIIFGLQAFLREYLIDYFNENFFNKPKEEVIAEYNRYLKYTLGEGTYKLDKIEKLHDLGYLPLVIKAIPEGTRVPMQVPMISISNTHKDFAWVTNAIESLMSCTLWHTMVSANVGYKYREIVNKYYDISVDENIPRNRALGDFSMRGQESLESAVKSSAAFCLSFLNTATVPAITYLENNYYCNIEEEDVIFGAVSTEHSVMCSNTAIDGNEIDFIKRLLTEIYPKNNFSMVSDSYDYWNLIQNILPLCEKEIMLHEGKLLIRPDSGNPIDIICGTKYFNRVDNLKEFISNLNEVEYEKLIRFNTDEVYIVYMDSYFRVIKKMIGSISTIGISFELENYTPTVEDFGSIEILWDNFGGTFNKKGYKVLNNKIGLIYGDSITLNRAEKIYQRLIMKGFSCENVIFGVGSFSMQSLENNDGTLSPFTRDTFSIAVKATYGEVNGKPIMICKNPKTDNDNFKKSQKGCCYVYKEGDEIKYKDNLTYDETTKDSNLLKTVFMNGTMINEYRLNEIRKNLWNNNF